MNTSARFTRAVLKDAGAVRHRIYLAKMREPVLRVGGPGNVELEDVACDGPNEGGSAATGNCDDLVTRFA